VASAFLARARARTRERVLSNAARRARTAKPPQAALLAHRAVLLKIAREYAAVVREILFPVLEDLAAEPAADAVRTDAKRDDETFRELRKRARRLTEAPRFRKSLKETSERVERHSRGESKRLGIRLSDTRPELRPLVERWRDRNVSLVRSLFDRELTVLKRILAQGEGLRVEALQKKIEERFGVTESKAELLARDQVLKLNGEITHRLQVSAGIEEYIWTTSGDERVRDRHAELDGTRQLWDEPPVVSHDARTAHPGDDYQCRCTAFPVLPELEEK
jgi:SPP1 gp7 family putative phage head morphogenesis protein